MPSRRQVLAVGCLALAGGAGCTEIRDAVSPENADSQTELSGTGNDTETSGTGDGTETGGASDGTETADAGEASTADASDLRVTVTDGDGEVELFTGADVATVGEVESARSGDGYRMAVTLTSEGTEAFAAGLEDVGALEDPDSHRIRTYFEGERLYEARLGADFADAIERGAWDGEFLFHVSDRETAEEVKAALEQK